ncbi:M23 family metallopeptidase [Synechococcus sp. CBW1107]|uniref:M23 family metallopeptidase n=1 Tax=Synechococcus sp. CBW1107 TaxID=2789857 RepID=UPI002AD3F163|nr:M23 family metallopeptidase [Synechococcus sp. CBW1107]
MSLQLGLAFDLGLTPQRARSDLRWARGVFPIVHFAGYTSHFGRRTGPGGGREMHSGLDIAAPLGSPIRNWWAGTVADVFHDGSCGVGVVIRSGDYEHMYCHLAGAAHGGTYASGPVLLRPGQRVRAGQLIAHVGLSGRTTGPHLHWGIRYRGTWLDPGLILRAMVRGRRLQPQSPQQFSQGRK